MTNQQRNRRKARVVSDHALLTLHKYYLRAEHMRARFHQARDRLVKKHGREALKGRVPSTEGFDVEMFLDHWYAGIYAAMEGYDKLGLTDPTVESLRVDPLYAKLRACRAGTYHFREKYFDDDIRAFLGEKKSAAWMVNLDTALGRFLLAELQTRKQRCEAVSQASE